MDPITQSALGAALAQSALGSKRLLRVGLAGAVGGLLPDADMLIRSPSDPLLFLDYHRHFTHSLVFIPVGGVIAAALCSLLLRGKDRVRDLLLPASLGWATHGLLDACTSYGTYLYWPFSLERVSWHLISIVDPIFTLVLLVGLGLAARRQQVTPVRVGLVLALGYLLFASFQLHRAQEVQDRLVVERGHEALRGEVKPSIANNLLYRSFYESDGNFYVDAIRVSWFGPTQVYPGESHPSLSLSDYAEEHSLSALHIADIERFRYFSSGFVIEDPRHSGVLSDFRYAAIPDAIAPLWGIDVLGTPADQHLEFLHFRSIGPADRERFFGMLQGKKAPW